MNLQNYMEIKNIFYIKKIKIEIRKKIEKL